MRLCMCQTTVDDNIVSAPSKSAPTAHCKRTGRGPMTTIRALGLAVVRGNTRMFCVPIRTVSGRSSFPNRRWSSEVYECAGVGA
eukprot:3641716-Lingulodinium_polyedra.AAC.1